MGILNYTDAEVKNWLQGKSQAEIAQQAASMGLNADQVQQALAIGGQNYTTNDIKGTAASLGYDFGGANGAARAIPAPSKAPTVNGTAVGAGNFYGYNGNSYSTEALDPNATSFLASNGQTYTKQQINDWYNQIDPSTGLANRASYGADMRMQAELGLQAPDLYKARFLGGTSDTSTGIYTAAAEMDPYGQYLKSAMQNGGPSKALSFYDWRAQQDPAYLASLAKGATGNLGYSNAPEGGVPINYRAGDGATNGTATPATGPSTGPTTTTNPSTTTTGGATTKPAATGGSLGVTPWNVTKEQTVEERVRGILASGSPLIEQQRAQSDQAMNGRGLLNSSIARTASDAAAYQAALPIAQADAATFAKASGYNADQQNQFATNDLNRAAQLEIARLNADTSKIIASWNNSQSKDALQIQLDNKTLLDTNAQAAQAFNTGMSAVNNIQNNASMDGNAKTVAIATVWKNVQTQLRTLSAVSGINISTELQFAGFPGFDDKGRWVGFGDTPAPTVTSPATTPVNEPVDNRA